MSRRRLSICIEGLPYVLGNDVPSWHSGTLDPGLVEWPSWTQEIDSLGGVSRVQNVDIELIDAHGHWAPLLRVMPDSVYYVTAPNPVEYDTTTVTMRDATGIAVDDLLYADADTWTVTDISGAPDIVVTRGTYSCLDDGLSVRYQTGVGREETVIVAKTGPLSIMGRVVAIYLDDTLEFLGYIVDLQQHGRAWTITARWTLGVLARQIEKPNVGIRLRNAWNYNYSQWGAGEYGAAITGGTERGGNLHQMVSDWTIGPDGGIAINIGSGWQWVGSDDYTQDQPQEIREGGLTHGANAALGQEWLYRDGGIKYCTQPLGVRPYGIMYANNGNPDYLTVDDIHYQNGIYDLDAYVGLYLECGDQLLRVQGVDTVNGYVYFDRIVDKASGTTFLQVAAGYSADQPIELEASAIIEANDIEDALNTVLTGTGPLSLGLPSEIISDAPAPIIGGAHSVWWDWSDTGMDDDLRARGLAVVLRGGKIRLIQVIPPQSTAATTALTQSDLTLATGVPEIDRGYEAPVSAITYGQPIDGSITVSYATNTSPTRGAVRRLTLTSGTGDQIVDLTAWLRLQASRLRWMAPGIPVINVQLMDSEIQIGEIVTLSSKYVSDGNYRERIIPALVIGRDPVNGRYQLACNIGADDGASWAYAIEIDSATGAVITPSLQDDLDVFAEFIPVGSGVMITEHDSTSSIWTGTVLSYQATTITLSSAPSIGASDVAILTVQNVADTGGEPFVGRQVYAADGSGEFEGYPARLLI